MKTVPFHASRTGRGSPAPRRRREGTAMVVVLALLAIILIYVADNLKTLNHLSRELKLVEQHQLRRLHGAAGAGTLTNTVPQSTTLNPQPATQ